MRGMVLLPPLWLIHIAVAAVWLYEGLWCKLLGGEPRQIEVVTAVPRYGQSVGGMFLKSLGVIEVGLAGWVLSGIAPLLCAIVQTILLLALNASGLIWARHLIHDPAGMVLKNGGFRVRAWVLASFPGWS